MANFTMSLNCIDLYRLNEEQAAAAKMFVKFMSDDNQLCMSLSGYAGTGKTYTLSILAKALELGGIKVTFVAPTNKAVQVMRDKGIENAQTVHKFIYVHKKDGKGGFKAFKRISLGEYIFTNGLIIVDESSMASNRVIKDLEEYAEKTGCKILFVGDPGQLPAINPKNEKPRKVFEEFDYKAKLTKVMRQANGSSILDLATAIRNNNIVVPDCNRKDVAVCSGEKAFANYVQKVREGKSAAFICYSNKTRVTLNHRVRRTLGYKDMPMDGEKFIAINNVVMDEDNMVANGSEFNRLGKFMGNVTVNGKKGYVFAHPDHECTILSDKPDAYILVLPDWDKPSFASATTVEGEMSYLFFNGGGYYDLIRENRVVVCTYAYAITGHKSQGSQWDYVYVDEIANCEDANKWYYTVVTRAVKGLVLTNNIKARRASWSQLETMAYGKVVSAKETVTEPKVEAHATTTAPVTTQVVTKSELNIPQVQQTVTIKKTWTVTIHNVNTLYDLF